MPEGDSIHRVAALLGPLLVGKVLDHVRIAGATHTTLAGATVTAITPVGKHMLVDLDRGWQLRVHLGMYGAWRRYRVPRPAPGDASLVLGTATDAFACVRARTVELLARRDPRAGGAVAQLGPDVLAPGFDPAAAAARARACGHRAIGEVLLDQRVAAGVGNVYKSEILFLERTDPLAPTAALDDSHLVRLFTRARTLMLPNLAPGGRVTRPGPRGARPHDERYYVYRRTGRPCTHCGARIVSRVQGEALRRTYYCPRCQA